MPVQMQNQQHQHQSTRQMIVDQIAYVEGRTSDEITSRIDAAGGDLEIDSKLGQTVAIRVAVLLDMEDLIRPEDQKRKHLTSITSLEDLISRRLADYAAKED